MWHELYVFIYRYIRRRGIPHSDAEDLAQEVLEAACVHLDAVAPGKLHAWLIAVARNKIVDRARRDRRSFVAGDVPDIADTAPGPMDSVLQAGDRAALLEAVANLPERDRRLIEMRYLEERTVEGTARELNMTTNATKVALFRARERLRAILETLGGTDE